MPSPAMEGIVYLLFVNVLAQKQALYTEHMICLKTSQTASIRLTCLVAVAKKPFCLYLIGFLYLVSTIQEKVQCQDDIEKFYQVSPLLIQGVLMLIENAVVRDRYRKQNDQRARQKRHREE